MIKKSVYFTFIVMLLLSLSMTACQPAAEAPPAAAPATEAPAVQAPAVFEPLSLAADNCDYGGEFKSVEALDEFTVKFSLCYPDPAFIAKLPMMSFAIQDKEYLDANSGDAVKMSEAPNGTGPYMYKEWVKGDHVTLVANPNYWGDKAKTETFILRWSQEPSQRLLEIQSGTVDGIDNPSPDDLTTIQADSNLQLVPRNSINIFWLNMNNTIPPFDNPLVRKAVAMAIDKQRIVDNYYPPGSIVAETFLPPTLYPGYTDMKFHPYDVEGAKALLAEAGFPDGFTVDLTYRAAVRTYLPLPDKVAQEFQAQLAEVGITVNIQLMESTSFLDDLFAGKLAMSLIGGNGDYPDATNLFDWIFNNPSTSSIGEPYPDIAAELSAAGKLGDPAARQVHYDKANELFKEYVPVVPIAHGASSTAWLKSVQNVHSSPFNKEAFQVMDSGKDQLVFMQGAEPAVIVCPDENDDETTRPCSLMYETLVFFKPGEVELQPVLAESWEPNEDATEWTFKIRQGVKFHNGATLDANDVVATFISQWDAASPNHVGRTGSFDYFASNFGQFLNAE